MAKVGIKNMMVAQSKVVVKEMIRNTVLWIYWEETKCVKILDMAQEGSQG